MDTKYDVNKLFKEISKTHTTTEIAKKLNVNNGTINRWKQLDKVPENYIFDLLKMNNQKIDYSLFSYAEKDQFYTPITIAKQCIDTAINFIDDLVDTTDYTFIEPSAGQGSFYDLLPEPKIGFDIESANPNIILQDFLEWQPPIENKYILIGNPPFGLRGQKALQFMLHGFKFCDFVAFILPPLFNSDGRGTPKKRVGQHLLYSQEIGNKYFYPDNKPINVNTIFQIWSKQDFGIDLNEDWTPVGYKVYSLSNGGTPATTRNADKIDKCDYYLPSTVFGTDRMKLYNSFEELPQQRGYGVILEDKALSNLIENLDWSKTAFYSTNNAINLRTSLIVKAIERSKK